LIKETGNEHVFGFLILFLLFLFSMLQASLDFTNMAFFSFRFSLIFQLFSAC